MCLGFSLCCMRYAVCIQDMQCKNCSPIFHSDDKSQYKRIMRVDQRPVKNNSLYNYCDCFLHCICFRNVVGMMLAAIDPVGVEQRSRRRLIRRHYWLKVNLQLSS